MSQTLQPKYRLDYRPPDYTITDVDLTFALDAEATVVTAISKVQRQGEHTRPLILDGGALTLLSVSVDDVPCTDYQIDEEGRLILRDLPASFTLRIENRIHPAQNTALEGLYQSGDALCTQCEAEGFRQITWYLDRPDVLARFRTRLIASKARYPYLLSNGNCVGRGDMEDGRHWVQWEDPFPKPCYLFALVAGDFDVERDTFVTRSGRVVALELYVNKGNLDRAGWAMTSLKNAMRWDEMRFGLEYDLDIYMVVAVDFFNMGAMENKGLNIFNDKYVLANAETATDKDYLNIEAVIGHEYFHNWTGNRITCRDWFQLSLKEGLTVFRDQEFSSDLGSRSANRIDNVRVLRSAQFAEDAGPMAHPVRPDQVIEMNNFYTLTVYEKGAEVIRMLHTLLGEAAFQAGMRLYVQRFDGCAVTCDDFVQAMEDASGIDLTQFRRWYSQAGTPELTVKDEYDAEARRYTLQVSQYTPPTADGSPKAPLHIPLDIELYAPDGAVIPLQHDGEPVHHVLNVREAQQTFVFDNVPARPVPSLLREFSAPVKLCYDWQDAQLTFLMRHARDPFSRWDAAQSLLAIALKRDVADYQQNRPRALPAHIAEAFAGVLGDERAEPMLRAQIFTLPSENEISEWFSVIDPTAIAAVRRELKQALGRTLLPLLFTTWQEHALSEYRIDHADIGKRALRNICLSYLADSGDPQAETWVEQQYGQANNMTDSLAALTAAVQAELPCADALLAQFAARWQHDPLVMDKWFTLQATRPGADALERVRQLLHHPAFSLQNPNRVRALIGAFCAQNPAAFHAADGSGYRFLQEMLVTLNQRNPQVASRLIEPLLRWKRYDANRQAQMRAVLEQLRGLDKLSNDLYEKISKALA